MKNKNWMIEGFTFIGFLVTLYPILTDYTLQSGYQSKW